MENSKKYDNKKYYQNFKEKNGEKLNEKSVCEICGGKYSYFNKAHHNKSKKHCMALEIIKRMEDKFLVPSVDVSTN